jgi:hypothetical protein
MPPKRIRKVPTKRTADDSPTAAPKPPLKRRATKAQKAAEAKAIAELEAKQKFSLRFAFHIPGVFSWLVVGAYLATLSLDSLLLK